MALQVVDLAKQTTTVMFRGDAAASVLGACFSPKGGTIAYSVHTYAPGESSDPPRSAYSLVIRNVASNKVVRIVKGAIRPGCR